MRCVLLGPPGAGKGSLAGLVKEMMGVVHISTGDMLREEMKTGSALGLEIKALIEKGSLVSDEIATKLVEHKVATDPDLSKGSFTGNTFTQDLSNTGIARREESSSCREC